MFQHETCFVGTNEPRDKAYISLTHFTQYVAMKPLIQS